MKNNREMIDAMPTMTAPATGALVVTAPVATTTAASSAPVATPPCERAMNRFFALDKDELLPLSLTLHLLGCKRCRTEVRLLTLSERVAARPLRASATPREVSALVAQVRSQSASSAAKNPVTLTNWIIGGVLMVCFMLAFVLLTRSLKSNLLSVSFYLVFAGSVTAYCALFVGANMDFFVKKIKTLQLSL